VGINFVPTQQAYIIERFGKFHKVLKPGSTLHLNKCVNCVQSGFVGLNFNIPIIDRISYVQNLKEIPVEISPQTAITADNVGIEIDGILYIKVVDPYKASYGVDDAVCEYILLYPEDICI
jgi:regulator of protease activity HflC (stomatin/prohibitin superfamily)